MTATIERATTRLEATFVRRGDRTQLAHCYAAAPLKIAKTFDDDGIAHVCLMDASPGLMAGDDYHLTWRLGAGARARITTQGFTRVHPSVGRPSRLRQRVTVAEDACLDYCPEPLLLYCDGALRNEGNLEVATGGTLLYCEIVGAGRIAREEAFQFAWFESRLRASYGGRLVYVNQSGLRPACDAPQRIGGWQGYTHQGTFLVIGERADAVLRDSFRDEMDAVCGDDLQFGASLLERSGVIVNLLGRRAWDLQQAVAGLRAVSAAHIAG